MVKLLILASGIFLRIWLLRAVWNLDPSFASQF